MCLINVVTVTCCSKHLVQVQVDLCIANLFDEQSQLDMQVFEFRSAGTHKVLKSKFLCDSGVHCKLHCFHTLYSYIATGSASCIVKYMA